MLEDASVHIEREKDLCRYRSVVQPLYDRIIPH